LFDLSRKFDRAKHMDDWPEVYKLESVEQLRAAADDLRQRILEELVKRPQTVTQLGQALRLAPAKVHYHVRELQRVGLVALVETREKGGILEKYYRTVARRLYVPRELFQRTSPEDPIAALQTMLDATNDAFTRALLRSTSADGDGQQHPFSLARTHLWLTPEQYDELSAELLALFQKYEEFGPTEERRQYTFVHMDWDTELAAIDEPERTPVSPSDLAQSPRPEEGAAKSVPESERTWSVGVIHVSRIELERALSKGKRLDITITGIASFGHDVTPELAERAIGRFKHRGSLRASPAVLEVLARKEEETTEGSMQ
jgi:DNA-binding transcriptional ArsR family regulator